jgi:ribosomal protein L24
MNYKKCHLKSGDFVYIKSGNNRGNIGKILSISRKNLKALVTLQSDLSKTIFIHVSNLFFYDISISQFSRVGYTIKNNKKERYLKKIKNIKN